MWTSLDEQKFGTFLQLAQTRQNVWLRNLAVWFLVIWICTFGCLSLLDLCVCPSFAANAGLINHFSFECFDVMHDLRARMWVFYFEGGERKKKKSPCSLCQLVCLASCLAPSARCRWHIKQPNRQPTSGTFVKLQAWCGMATVGSRRPQSSHGTIFFNLFILFFLTNAAKVVFQLKGRYVILIIVWCQTTKKKLNLFHFGAKRHITRRLS